MSPTEISASLATALLLFGGLLKHAVPTPAINRWIPLILVMVGTPAYCALVGDWQALAWLQGFLTATSATGIHQTITKPTGLQI
jgi:hypothetical protein